MKIIKPFQKVALKQTSSLALIGSVTDFTTGKIESSIDQASQDYEIGSITSTIGLAVA